ncbi:EF-P 5-aminopentanol modification-associated protein YfmF [Agrilactobacillus yilanensis]|uniref:EF-P 5-aminopentanol modification-associated protein YfmF n=1 Tax=Agrilactobacillus yilanensis TaxID=2485997 RepID=A0ABW4JC17_9LACO|nr:pitrilysin family protein [Agrilactobacillus yilanensis]
MDQIHQGIYLQVDQTKKFKTINFSINFLEPLHRENISRRALLANILENSNETDRTPDQIAAKLENLYGANFSFGQFTEGQVSVLSISGICPAPQFLPDQEDVFGALLALVKKSLFQPAKAANLPAFDSTIFDREKLNLQHKIQSYLDDKQYAAMLATKALYFGADSAQAISSLGDIKDLEAITAENLWQYLTEMLEKNQILITVTGDTEAIDLEQLFDWSELQDRATAELPLFYNQPLTSEVAVATDYLPVTQGKLNLIYQAPVKYYQGAYFAYLVANTIFGGSAQSLLFLDVREKSSLAYYASSAIDTFTGTVTVQTGIDSDKKKEVLDKVAIELQLLQSGSFDETLFENAKKLLVDQFAMRSDSPFGRNLRYLFKFLEPQVMMSVAEFTAAIDQVTMAQVKAAAATFELQAIYAIEKEG